MAEHITILACQHFYQLPARIICILVLIYQMIILDYYMVTFYNKLWWFWVIPDIISIAVFCWAFVISYIHLKKTSHEKNHTRGGELPFGYIAWGVYAIFLSAKIGIIYRNIAPTLIEDDFFGPNMLKCTLACSAIIFFLLVVTHHDAEPQSKQQGYINSLTGSVTMDVLDTVSLLNILFLQVSRIFLSFEMHHTIIAIGIINVLLPVVPLLILSKTRFGHGKMPELLHTIHTIVYLLAINLPNLVIRLLLWHLRNGDISVFVIKNVMGIGLTIKAIHQGMAKVSEVEGVDGGVVAHNKEMTAMTESTFDKDGKNIPTTEL